MPYSFVGAFQGYSPFANLWNPNQVLSSTFNTLLGGYFPGYGNISVGGGQTLNFSGLEDFPYGLIYSMKNP